MSIPKEPRQLMINLMYLVLTALLALNVSAEVLHAFFSIDESLAESSRLVNNSNGKLIAAIGKQAEAYSQYEPIHEKAQKVEQIAQTFSSFVENLKNDLVEQAGGIGEDGMPVRKSDKNVPTNLFINQGNGDLLEQKIRKVRTQLLAIVEDEAQRSILAQNVPLKVPSIPEHSDKKTWAHFKFDQMPVAAVMPILSKLQHDAEVAATSVLNYFLNQVGGEVVVSDAFEPVIATNKSYVIRGEEFRGEIFLAAYSSTADNISVTVDGRSYPVQNGKATFSVNPNSLGIKNHEMSINLNNPITGESQSFKKQFSYEVGERSAVVSADKMNVFYVGVENPISVSVAGVPSNKIQVQAAESLGLKKSSNHKYIVLPQQVGQASITVSGGGLEPTKFNFRVKRIPDPVLRLGNKKGGRMSKAEFQVQHGIIAWLENFDFEARCKVQEFELVRVRKNDDPASAKNAGGRYETRAKELVGNAQINDIYYFENVKVRCPGDVVSRKMDGMYFKIK